VQACGDGEFYFETFDWEALTNLPAVKSAELIVRLSEQFEYFFQRLMIEIFLQTVLQTADILRTFIPESEIGIILTEFRNKLQAFYLFQHADSVLNLSTANLTLPEMLAKTSTLGPFLSVWATEGLGHYYTRQCMIGKLPEGLLCDGASFLPAASLVPLHAGMGLALAEFLLDQAWNSRILADRFLHLCRSNACEGYVGVAFESLGVVVRNLRPDLITHLDRDFAQVDEEWLAYFWHGVGRGIYFTAANSLPWIAPWRGYQICLQEPPHLLGKLNALAGFAWALTLVNLQCPQILSAFLRYHQANFRHEDAFANGIFSAAMIWLESAPKDFSVQVLRSYQPEQSGPFLMGMWDRCVRQPCNDALDNHRLIQSSRNIGQLFRYKPLRGSLTPSA